MGSRKIEDLTPAAQRAYVCFAAGMEKAHIPYIVTCTYRDQTEQIDLWNQGRLRPGPVVTWTKHSVHTERRAWDIAIRKPGSREVTWDLKCDVNENEIPDYEEAAEIGRSLRLRVGADFSRPDYPHFEVPVDWAPPAEEKERPKWTGKKSPQRLSNTPRV